MTSIIRNTLNVLSAPGQVVEVRALAENGTHSGYFTDFAALARQVEALDADPSVHGCYVTLNAVNPVLLARRANRIKMHLNRSDATTSDTDIIRRRWLPVDIDPVRPSGVSSTNAEHALTLAKADEIAAWLSGTGFPEPVHGDSGNGAHLLYRIDLPNDESATKLVKAVLSVLDKRFSDAGVSVDPANYNAGRIWKLYGTMVRKGDSTLERPHRWSRIVSVPEAVVVVSREQLEALAAQLTSESPVNPPAPDGVAIDLRSWLVSHGIAIRSEKPYGNGGTIFVLEVCPFSSAHKDGAYAIQFANGAIHAGCHHASCGAGKQRWKELREKYETPREKHARQGARIKEWSKERVKAKTAIEKDGIVTPKSQTVLPDKVTSDEPPVAQREYPLTDAGNAERLIAQYGDVIRYCATYRSWYIWNGKVWARDEPGKMLIITTNVARSIHREAAEAVTPDRARALSRWALCSESLHSRKSMIDSAAPHIPVTPGEFDAAPNLFNCRNGTIELDTLTFREHRKEDMLTKMAAVDYEPGGQCPRWIEHLNLLFAGDTDYLSGFQEMCGYTMLGTNPQQIMFILYGRGRNGKSKTIEVLARIFGNYAVNIAAESLMAKRFENAVRSDLARLEGARLATAAEGAEGDRMDEATIKQLTGERAITVRRLYENDFEFPPVTKIWMTTNHEPVIRGTDEGIWRRLWMLPFIVQIPEDKCDPDIAAKLLSESSGILNWCLMGIASYYAKGRWLVQPSRVQRATSNLRTVNDTVGLFLITECAIEPEARMSRSALKETFEKWCDEEGMNRRISAHKFASALKERGVLDGGKVGYDRFWTGIRLKHEDERIAAEKSGGFQDVLPGA